MRKVLFKIFILLVFACLIINPATDEKKKENLKKKKIIESVSVVNVEVPVRVFFGGTAVDNLKKSDFRIYENGKLQEINGFWVKRKKLTDPGSLNRDSIILPSRYFFLVFKTTRFNKSLESGIRYVFEKILSEKDIIMIFINNKSYLLDNLKNKKRILSMVLKTVSEECKKARRRQLIIVDRIRGLIKQMKMDIAGLGNRRSPADVSKKLLESYLDAWNEYKKRFLTPDINSYYNFARYLEKIKMDKWVLNFYQLEVFPKLKPTGDIINYIKNLIDDLRISIRGEDIAYSQMLSSLLMRINIALDVSQDFPTDQISKLFYKVGAVFHTIFIRTRNDMLSKDIEYRKVSTDLENNFRKLTRITGGELIASNDLKGSLNKITQKRDVLYVLTYYPTNPDKKGDVRVECSNKNYKVIYDNNIRQDYIKRYFAKMEKRIPAVKVLYANFIGRKLKVAVNGFYLRKEGKRKLGKLKIHIVITNAGGKQVFDQEKILVADKKNFTVSLKFPSYSTGSYSCVISVHDLLTDKTDIKYITTEFN